MIIDWTSTDIDKMSIIPQGTSLSNTIISQYGFPLNKINKHLEQVRQDAKQLANMSNTQIATSAAASLLTDLVGHANSAFAGQLDPATNAQQEGATWVHDAMPQLATLTVNKEK